MHRCSSGCGTNSWILRDERLVCSGTASSASLKCKGGPKQWQIRHAPQAAAAGRRGPRSGIPPHRRRQGDFPGTASAGANADFSAADIVNPSLATSASVAPIAPVPAIPRKGLTGLAARVVFGVLLGLSGAVVILTGGKVYMGIACLVAYQASQEYFGFLTSKVRVWRLPKLRSCHASHPEPTHLSCCSHGRDYFCSSASISKSAPKQTN